MADMEMRRAALLGTGVIGAGWAARLIHHGVAVTAYDPDPAAETRLRQGLDGALAALARLTEGPPSTAGHLDFTTDLTAAVVDADLIQENAPERLELKKDLLIAAGAAAKPAALIASSTSGYRPSQLQDGVAHPERVLVAHPFNPVYLLPLVEVVGGAETDPAVVARAADFYRRIGMHPLIVRREIDGHLSDRLQEALWREALHLVNDGIATTDELDQAIVYGPGLRWALMGTCLTFHLAGGEEGMRHMLAQFGPALKLPWTKLEAPELTADLIDKMVDQTAAQAGSRSIDALVRERDDGLIAIQRALADLNQAAGATLRASQALAARLGAAEGD